MIEDIFVIPGERDAVDDVVLAILYQAAKDLAVPLTCPAAMEWFLSDEYQAYSKALGINSEAFLRKLIKYRYQLWKNWPRTVVTYQVVRKEDNKKFVVGIGAHFTRRKLTIVCFPNKINSYPNLNVAMDNIYKMQGLCVEWTTDRMQL